MELETLKSIWKEQDVLADAATSREELLALLHKQSHGPIDRMRRNLRKEAVILIITYIPVILFYLVGFEGRMSGIAWLMAGVLLFFLLYYDRKNRLLKKMQCVSCEVRSNLSGQLKTLKKYIRFYFWSSTLAVPVAIIFSFLIALLSRATSDHPYNYGRGITLLLALTVVLTIVVYFVSRWNINRLYGRHILKLQDLLREMDED